MNRHRRIRRFGPPAGALVGLVLVALSAAGCELLFPGFSEDFPEASPIATYSKGTATLTLEDGTKIVLDKLNAGPHLWTAFGSQVRWSDGDGWHLRVSGAGEAALYMSPSVSFDRIADGQHWTTWNADACDVQIDLVDATALRGTATCEGLKWVDSLDFAPMSEGAPYVPDQPRFDLTVSFEATR
jgi:hypothetical protein